MTSTSPGGGASSPVTKGRKARTDERVFDAVVDLLRTYGLAAVSVEAVAGRSGVAKTTIYRRYRDRTEMLEAAIAHHLPVAALPEHEDPRQGLAGGVRQVTTATERYLGTAIIAVLAARDDPAAAVVRDRVAQPRIDLLASRLAGWVEAGQLRADLDVDLTVSTIMGAIAMTYARHGGFSDEWPERFVEHLWPLLRPVAAAI